MMAGARHSEHPGPGARRDLNREGADPATGAVDEQPFPGLEAEAP